jgi:hypothetical protein
MTKIATLDHSRPASGFLEPSDPWSLPVFRLGTLPISFSYLIFVAAAILFGATLTEAVAQSGVNAVQATALATLFWVSGWVAQACSLALVAHLLGSPLNRLSIGLFGVKAYPKQWSPATALAASLAAVAALISLASLYRWMDGGGVAPLASFEPQSIWTAPSIGESEHDSPWLAGGWICFAQAIFQLLPLGHTLGRQISGSCIALLTRGAGIDFQIRVFRSSLLALALIMVGVSVRLYIANNFPGWLIVLGLGLAVWASTKATDLVDIFLGFDQHEHQHPRAGVRENLWQLIKSSRGRRRTRLALQRERGEAIDANRLDQVLSQLHARGAQSLSREDRQLLQRVSERIRQQRGK